MAERNLDWAQLYLVPLEEIGQEVEGETAVPTITTPYPIKLLLPVVFK